MSLYYLILWNQVDILQKHFKKDHVHMRLWARFYNMMEGKISSERSPNFNPAVHFQSGASPRNNPTYT